MWAAVHLESNYLLFFLSHPRANSSGPEAARAKALGAGSGSGHRWLGPASDQLPLSRAVIPHPSSAPAPSAGMPLLLRTGECAWDDCLCAAACGLQPLRSAYPSLRPFFVAGLGVVVMHLGLGVRALRALAETPWHLMQDRLVGHCVRQKRMVASAAEAGLAMLEEMEEQLRQAEAGDLTGQAAAELAHLDEVYLLASSHGSKAHACSAVSKLLPAKPMGVYLQDSPHLARCLASASLLRAPRHTRSLWLANPRWTPEGWAMTRALRARRVLLSLAASAFFGRPKIWSNTWLQAQGRGPGSPPREQPEVHEVVREEVLERMAR